MEERSRGFVRWMGSVIMHDFGQDIQALIEEELLDSDSDRQMSFHPLL